jgi:hypothetical protein
MLIMTDIFQDARQLSSMFGSANAAAMEPVTKVKLQPQYDPRATRELVVWGPFKLQAAGVSLYER